MLRFIVEISPGEIAVNRAWRVARRGRKSGLRKSDTYAHARSVVAEAAMLELEHAGLRTFEGPARVSVHAVWAGGEGDVDAPAKGVLDALQDAGVLVDDAQVLELVLTKEHSSSHPRLEIEISKSERIES